MYKQHDKNREQTAREASKRGERGSLTENGKLYRRCSFNSSFFKTHTLKIFLEKYLFRLLSQAGHIMWE